MTAAVAWAIAVTVASVCATLITRWGMKFAEDYGLELTLPRDGGSLTELADDVEAGRLSYETEQEREEQRERRAGYVGRLREKAATLRKEAHLQLIDYPYLTREKIQKAGTIGKVADELERGCLASPEAADAELARRL